MLLIFKEVERIELQLIILYLSKSIFSSKYTFFFAKEEVVVHAIKLYYLQMGDSKLREIRSPFLAKKKMNWKKE